MLSVDSSGIRGWLIVVALGASCAWLTGCGSDDAGGFPANCPKFADIVSGTFERQVTSSVWTLQVAQIPAEFVLNQTAVGLDVLEYRWGVELDSDKDGEADLIVSLDHTKRTGGEQRVTSIVDALSSNVWSRSGILFTSEGTPQVTLTGTTFEFRTEDDMAIGLSDVTARSQVRWTTTHLDGKIICEDSYQ